MRSKVSTPIQTGRPAVTILELTPSGLPVRMFKKMGLNTGTNPAFTRRKAWSQHDWSK